MAIPVRQATASDLLEFAHCDKCSLCPAERQKAPYPVHGIGPADAELIVIGEAPGPVEVTKGTPFIGQSGELLWKTISESNNPKRPANIYATNALLCQPTRGTLTTSKQIEACRDRLYAELAQLTNVKVILLAGAKAAEAMVGHKVAMGRMNGRAEWSERFGCWLVYAYHPAAVLRRPEWYTDFKHAVGIAIEYLTRQHSEEQLPDDITFTVAATYRDVGDICNELSQARTIVCDIETTGLNPMTDRVLDIGFAVHADRAYIIPADLLDHAEAHHAIKTLLEDPTFLWVYHNGKFDTNMLRAAFDFDARIGADTLLLHHALDERGGGEEGGHHDLKSLATKYCGAPNYSEGINGADMAHTDPVVRHTYHANDLCYTLRLYHTLQQQLAKEPPSRNNYPSPLICHDTFLVPVANALADVELRGIRIDEHRWLSLCDEYTQRINDTRRKICEYVEKPLFNPNSTPQVLAVLKALKYPVIKSTSKAVLHELQAFDREYGRVEEPFLRDVLEYRSLVHTKATYLIGLGHDVFDRVTVYSDGYRVRTHLLMHGTATGRLASRDPNLQNIPKDSPIREMFVPTDGYTFIEADYAQLEVRVLAWISEDRELAATVREKDVHWATASRVWPALTRNMLAALGSDDELSELEELCHTNSMFLDFYLRQRGPNRTNKASELYDWMKTRIRRQAKYVTFGIMYGEGAEALSLGEKGLGVPVKEAQSYIDNWRATYRQAWAWLQQQAAFAKYERWVESPNGRRRRFGYPDELSHVANEAMNFPIQSFASDINLAALVKLNHRLRSERCGFVLLPVHDSQLFEVPTDQLATGEDYIRSAMTTVIRDDQVTFDVDLKRGSSWADLH